MNIRYATPADAGKLLAIYAPYVVHTAITFEYDVPSVTEFRDRIETTLKDWPYLVVEDDAGEPAGYCYVHSYRPRKAYERSVETSIYVRRDAHGAGYGRMLYESLEKELKAKGIRNLVAVIGTTRDPEDPYLTNASVYFHEKMGYTHCGTVPDIGFKFGRWYDSTTMQKIILP
ncbi:MAG: GNAT family N-acetyltransferase [Clostridia bacterium]|nr:GNAT family N-acetyltransferase [Clostridia bacterium]